MWSEKSISLAEKQSQDRAPLKGAKTEVRQINGSIKHQVLAFPRMAAENSLGQGGTKKRET